MTWRKHTPETIKSLTDAQLSKGRDKAALHADYGRNYWERCDGWHVLEMIEREQARRAGRILDPADPGDVRFEIGEVEDGMEETPFYCFVVDDQGEIIQRHWFAFKSEAYDMVGAWRDHQDRVEEADRLGVHPLEIEFAPYGPAWQAEQEQR